jgi:hypothetical protein
MLLITPQPDTVCAVAARHNIAAHMIGEITAHSGIRIHSRGYFSAEENLLTYPVS